LPWQQSHHCGIETCRYRRVRQTSQAGSNRTIVGLKLQHLQQGLFAKWGSNRTIVGLKPYFLNRSRKQVMAQQSHHCGIETEK